MRATRALCWALGGGELSEITKRMSAISTIYVAVTRMHVMYVVYCANVLQVLISIYAHVVTPDLEELKKNEYKYGYKTMGLPSMEDGG